MEQHTFTGQHGVIEFYCSQDKLDLKEPKGFYFQSLDESLQWGDKAYDLVFSLESAGYWEVLGWNNFSVLAKEVNGKSHGLLEKLLCGQAGNFEKKIMSDRSITYGHLSREECTELLNVLLQVENSYPFSNDNYYEEAITVLSDALNMCLAKNTGMASVTM